MTRDSPEPLISHLRKLAGHSAVYGAADVFTNVINFLLVPLYTSYLTPADYGVFALLLPFNTAAKILLRMGLDGAFFRVHYDLTNDTDRRRLAGTVFVFAAVVGTFVFALIVAGAGGMARLLARQEALPPSFLVLSALDVYLGVFAFVPLNLLRIQDRPTLFSSLSASRHALNTVLKVVLVTQGFGVAGVLVSDVVATGVFSLALVPLLARHSSFAFAPALLREVLRFGLPKVPHGLLIQAQNNVDRWILESYVTRPQLGTYQMGYTFGLAVKFAMSAFEPAWQPFVYSQIRKPGAANTLARVVTYAFLAFVTVGLVFAVFSRELLHLMTYRNPAFWEAAPVIPIVVLAYLLQGAFLLTSIGIGIEKRAHYYPIITAAAAFSNVGANLLLIPRFGIVGAAWATVVSYGVMAALGFWFSQRLFAIPFEWHRLGMLAGAAAGTYALSLLAPEALIPALGVKAACLLAYPALLLAAGFRLPTTPSPAT